MLLEVAPAIGAVGAEPGAIGGRGAPGGVGIELGAALGDIGGAIGGSGAPGGVGIELGAAPIVGVALVIATSLLFDLSFLLKNPIFFYLLNYIVNIYNYNKILIIFSKNSK